MKKNSESIYGIRAIIEAIQEGKQVEKVLVKRGLAGELFQELFTLIRKEGIPFQYVPIEKLNRECRGNHQGVFAYISPITFYNIDEIITRDYEEGKVPFVLVLDQITDIRNFGSICRSAECAGVSAVVIPQKGAAQINADAIKTSAGALHNIPVCKVESLKATIEGMKDNGLKIVAATEKADYTLYKIDLKDPLAIIMGAEDKGVSKQLLDLSDSKAQIPILGSIDSLNVSNACAVFLYEAIRQRM